MTDLSGPVGDDARSGGPWGFRIGDADRLAAMEALGEHLAAGRLDMDEYSDRSVQVTQARTAADLLALFTDLPAPHPTISSVPMPAVPNSLPVPAGSTPARGSRTGVRVAMAVLVPVSGLLALALFFWTKTWVVFLIPAVLALIGSAVWGSNWRDDTPGISGRDPDRRS